MIGLKHEAGRHQEKMIPHILKVTGTKRQKAFQEEGVVCGNGIGIN